jgi:hypothetical protein
MIAPFDIAAFTERCAAANGAIIRRDGALVQDIIRQVHIHDGRIEIVCEVSAIAALLNAEREEDAPETVVLMSEVRLTRSGMAMRLIQSNGSAAVGRADPSVIKQVVRARRWWLQLKGGTMNVEQLAAQEGIGASYMTRVLRLAFLAPAVVEAIMAGKTLPSVDAAALTVTDAVPASWVEQVRTMLPAG